MPSRWQHETERASHTSPQSRRMACAMSRSETPITHFGTPGGEPHAPCPSSACQGTPPAYARNQDYCAINQRMKEVEDLRRECQSAPGLASSNRLWKHARLLRAELAATKSAWSRRGVQTCESDDNLEARASQVLRYAEAVAAAVPGSRAQRSTYERRAALLAGGEAIHDEASRECPDGRNPLSLSRLRKSARDYWKSVGLSEDAAATAAALDVRRLRGN